MGSCQGQITERKLLDDVGSAESEMQEKDEEMHQPIYREESFGESAKPAPCKNEADLDEKHMGRAKKLPLMHAKSDTVSIGTEPMTTGRTNISLAGIYL